MRINVNTDKNSVLLGELVNFTIEIYNDEQYKLENVEFNISPCIGAVIIPRSILVNNKSINSGSYNKVFLEDIRPNEKLTINYIEKVEALTIESRIVFRGKLKFLSNGVSKEQNLVLKDIKINVLKLKIENFSDVNEGALNEEVKVQFTLKNKGTIPLIDLQLEKFWGKFDGVLQLKKIYINDKLYDYNKRNMVILRRLDIQECCTIKIVFKIIEVPEKLVSMVPKVKVKYRKEEYLYEEKIIDGNTLYINIHSNFLKGIEKTFIINRDTKILENIFYKIKVKDIKLNKIIVKNYGEDTERIILKIILSIVFKTDLYRECDSEKIQFDVLIPKKYSFLEEENIYVGIIQDVLKINDDNSLILQLKCNIYNNKLFENKVINSNR